MTGWFALVLIVAVVVATAASFAAGRKAGATTAAAKAQCAELKFQKKTSDAKGRMLEAGTAPPRDRDALAVSFQQVVHPGAPSETDVATYEQCLENPDEHSQKSAIHAAWSRGDRSLIDGRAAAVERAMLDYVRLRDQARDCQLHQEKLEPRVA